MSDSDPTEPELEETEDKDIDYDWKQNEDLYDYGQEPWSLWDILDLEHIDDDVKVWVVLVMIIILILGACFFLLCFPLGKLSRDCLTYCWICWCTLGDLCICRHGKYRARTVGAEKMHIRMAPYPKYMEILKQSKEIAECETRLVSERAATSDGEAPTDERTDNTHGEDSESDYSENKPLLA